MDSSGFVTVGSSGAVTLTVTVTVSVVLRDKDEDDEDGSHRGRPDGLEDLEEEEVDAPVCLVAKTIVVNTHDIQQDVHIILVVGARIYFCGCRLWLGRQK